jgi:hypothetical protein
MASLISSEGVAARHKWYYHYREGEVKKISGAWPLAAYEEFIWAIACTKWDFGSLANRRLGLWDGMLPGFYG